MNVKGFSYTDHIDYGIKIGRKRERKEIIKKIEIYRKKACINRKYPNLKCKCNVCIFVKYSIKKLKNAPCSVVADDNAEASNLFPVKGTGGANIKKRK